MSRPATSSTCSSISTQPYREPGTALAVVEAHPRRHAVWQVVCGGQRDDRDDGAHYDDRAESCKAKAESGPARREARRQLPRMREDVHARREPHDEARLVQPDQRGKLERDELLVPCAPADE